jgi:hypothetical protein
MKRKSNQKENNIPQKKTKVEDSSETEISSEKETIQEEKILLGIDKHSLLCSYDFLKFLGDKKRLEKFSKELLDEMNKVSYLNDVIKYSKKDFYVYMQTATQTYQIPEDIVVPSIVYQDDLNRAFKWAGDVFDGLKIDNSQKIKNCFYTLGDFFQNLATTQNTQLLITMVNNMNTMANNINTILSSLIAIENRLNKMENINNVTQRNSILLRIKAFGPENTNWNILDITNNYYIAAPVGTDVNMITFPNQVCEVGSFTHTQLNHFLSFYGINKSNGIFSQTEEKSEKVKAITEYLVCK